MLISPQRQAAAWTFAAALLVYLLTLAPDLTWAHSGGDGGELVAASMTFGVSHPHGYPTYLLLGRAFSFFVPLGSIAYRYNLFSAVCMAAAAAQLTRTTHSQETRIDIAAVAAGLTFAFAPLIWSQAIITEVYALNLLMLATVLHTIWQRPNSDRFGLWWGLSITTHLTSLLLGPLVLWHAWRQRKLPTWLLGTALGLLPLLWPLAAVRGASPIVWGDHTTLRGWWWLVSGSVYRPNTLAFFRVPERLGPFSAELAQQFSWLGWLLLLAGGALWLRKHNPVDLSQPATQRMLLLIGLSALWIVYAISYDTSDYRVFVLPALLLLTPPLAVSLRQLAGQQYKVASLLLPLLAVVLNFSALSLHGDYILRQRAEPLLDKMPSEALVLTPGDRTIFALWYFHYVEQQRTDLILVDQNLLAFDWYRTRLQRHYPQLEGLDVDDVAAFRRRNGLNHPICEVSIDGPLLRNCVTRTP